MLIPSYSSSTCKHRSKQTISNTEKGNYTHKGTSVSGRLAPGASRSGGLGLNGDSSSECTLSGMGENARLGTPTVFKTTVVHLVCGGYLMLLAPVIRTTPLFRPYRFRIYLACIIVYFDLELQTMGSVSCLDPSAFLLASPQPLNPSMPSLAAAGFLSWAQYPVSPPLCLKKGKKEAM